MPRWKVDCWNCDEGFLSYWSERTCPICKGTGALEVTELSDDNYETAVRMPEPHPPSTE